MGYSKTKIFNIALSNLGISALIQNASQDDPRAIILNNFYELARDFVLEAHDWSFANAFRDLSTSLISSPDPNYEFAYLLPNDCIAPRAAICLLDNQEKKFDPAIDETSQKIIVTNCTPCRLRYTRRIDNETLFTAGFVEVLGYKLASDAAQALLGSREKKELNDRDYQIALTRAIVFDARKSKAQDQDDNDFTDARC